MVEIASGKSEWHAQAFLFQIAAAVAAIGQERGDVYRADIGRVWCDEFAVKLDRQSIGADHRWRKISARREANCFWNCAAIAASGEIGLNDGALWRTALRPKPTRALDASGNVVIVAPLPFGSIFARPSLQRLSGQGSDSVVQVAADEKQVEIDCSTAFAAAASTVEDLFPGIDREAINAAAPRAGATSSTPSLRSLMPYRASSPSMRTSRALAMMLVRSCGGRAFDCTFTALTHRNGRRCHVGFLLILIISSANSERLAQHRALHSFHLRV